MTKTSSILTPSQTHQPHLSNSHPTLTPQTTTMSATTASDYEHWPDDSTIISSTTATVISGYDKFNGLRECEYEPANDDKPAAKPAPKANEKKVKVKKIEIPPAPEFPAPASQQQVQYAPPPQYVQYAYPPQMPYSCFPSYMAPAPAYYGLPAPQMQMQSPYGLPPGYVLAPVPVGAVAAEEEMKEGPPKKEKKVKKAEPMKWQGRTKAEVEEDNMKIAAKEGVYEKRVVEPVGLEDDQPVWVVLGDGSTTLR